MSEPRLNGGVKLLIPWSLLVGAAVGLVLMYSDVQGLKSEVKTKASQETVQTQYESLVREIQALRSDIRQRYQP